MDGLANVGPHVKRSVCAKCSKCSVILRHIGRAPIVGGEYEIHFRKNVGILSPRASGFTPGLRTRKLRLHKVSGLN